MMRPQADAYNDMLSQVPHMPNMCGDRAMLGSMGTYSPSTTILQGMLSMCVAIRPPNDASQVHHASIATSTEMFAMLLTNHNLIMARDEEVSRGFGLVTRTHIKPVRILSTNAKGCRRQRERSVSLL